MTRKNRDDFTASTKLKIAKRAGWLCSYPPCRTPTVGGTSDGQGEINIGTAAHICAAAPGGPRYDPNMSPAERSSANNGIWMCRDHGKAVDSTDPEFTVERLREWKKQAAEDSWRRVLRNEAPRGPAVLGNAQLAARLRAAAEADLAVFRRTARWPSTSVALTLKVDGLDHPATTAALATAVMSLDDLILVAAPGMGKTTTLFQVAEAVLTNGAGTPLVVPLGDWGTERSTVLGSILNRPAFRDISEDDFRAVATHAGMLLLLDGWNELHPDARTRARVEVERLKAELPELALMVSTRRQALDVPFVGARADLMRLNDAQQMEIATSMRGEAGARLVDQAWRTAGVRELVTIPLYLTALLSLPENEPFPTTKEQVLRHFVAAHETEARRAEALRAVARGFQQAYLDDLAVLATQTANTTIADSEARRSMSATAALLVANGQIANKPEPDTMLDLLVSNHVLMRAGETLAYSFQHQQFQEWYASHSVEHRILAAVADPAECEALKAVILNLPVWEEPILFAVERLARGDTHKMAACGKAILTAFEVDPILAAEMIFRSTDEVWTPIADNIRELIIRWHAPGMVDRALRFMLVSGRAEFVDLVWPLITHDDQQISLAALRNCRRFRPSILGIDAEQKIKGLTPKMRIVLLSEIASHSGMDGLNLAAAIARDDPDPEVQASVVDALAFRRADRHIAEVLLSAIDETYNLVVRKDLVDDVPDEHVRKRLVAARQRQIREGISDYHRLRAITLASDREDHSAELRDLVSSMTIEQQGHEVALIYEARNRYPGAVADGLLARLRGGRTLFYGADDILASAGFGLEDEDLLQLALAETGHHDDRAEAAASVLGPQAVGRMIDALLGLRTRLGQTGNYDPVASSTYHCLRSRIAHTPGGSLIAPVKARSAEANNQQITYLAELLSRDHNIDGDRARPFDADASRTVQDLAEDWGNRLLAAADSKRSQLASIATLVSHAPSVRLLPLLKRLLDDELRRYRGFRAEAQAAGWRHGEAVNEARTLWNLQYQRAFLAIDAPETAALMREYLTDEYFGEIAARVLASQWQRAHEPPGDERFLGGPDFSRVEEKHASRADNPAATSVEAEAIFTVVDALIADESTEEQKKLGVVLGIVGAWLPHGQRDGTIRKLIEMTPRRARANLLLNIVLSGEEIDMKDVVDGIAETFEAAKTETWILTQSEGYELRNWLVLLPFASNPAAALDVLRSMPAPQREPRFLQEMVAALTHAPSADAEEILFKLAEDDPRFYTDHRWRTTALRLGTESSARRIIDLAAKGVLRGGTTEDWALSRDLGLLIDQYSELRAYVYDLLRDGHSASGLALLAHAIAENPDGDGLMLLVRFETNPSHQLVGWRTIERVVTEHVPSENWKGAYDIVPIPALELRRKLLAVTTDGGPSDAAARTLTEIDKIRDEYGTPETEPRHPDLKSGKPWPIIPREIGALALN